MELLALLSKETAHGYELKASLESEMGQVWPAINIGQIYTTLGRLERDGLVQAEQVAQLGRPDKKVYELTTAGRQTLSEWLETPNPPTRVKDGFFIKLLLCARSSLADPVVLIDRQRRGYLHQLAAVHRLTESATTMGERLAAEGVALHLQADLRWLERCEEAFSQRETGDGSS